MSVSRRSIACAMALTAGLLSLAVAQDTSGKIPITTSSQEARELYLKARDLGEKLRRADARGFYEQAVAKDKNFALAYVGLAFTAPTSRDFFAAAKRAEELQSSVSAGEKLIIQGFIAGIKGQPDIVGQSYTKLVEAYPNDERAQNLLANHYYGQQDYPRAIKLLEKATKINPSYSPPYNMLGYVHSRTGNYPTAEKSFKRYIELIPNEPNPYDSYAELLMKMGRFDESINFYQQALAKNPNFVASYVGTGNNFIFKGNPEAARGTLQKLYGIARNDDERRSALFWMATSYLHEGMHDKAMGELKKRYDIVQKTQDLTAMAADLNTMGRCFLEAGASDEALSRYIEGVKLVERANVMKEVKEIARRNHIRDRARVALAKGDFGTARSLMAQYGEQVKAKKIPSELRRYHKLAGMIALQEKKYAQALGEFGRADQQDPSVIYALALARIGMGDTDGARVALIKVAKFNEGSLNYAFVRAKAQKMLLEK